jgi:hypothetical protein
MARKLFGLWNNVTGRRLRALLLDAILIVLAAALAIISLALSALAFYVLLAAADEPGNTALIVSAAAELYAIAVLILWVWPRGGARASRAAAISSSSSQSLAPEA